MADCLYHGYSSGPTCRRCQQEDAAGEERGTRGQAMDQRDVIAAADAASIGHQAPDVFPTDLTRPEPENPRTNESH